MSNDLENDNLDEDAGFDDFDGDGSDSNSFGSLVQSNNLVKFGIIFGVAALVLGAIILFGGDKEKLANSVVSEASEVSAAPGTDEVSPAYVDAIQDVNRESVERALAQGESAIPIPIEPPVGRIEQAAQGAEEEDPLQKWRRLQEERMKREMEDRQLVEAAPAPEDTGQSEAIAQMAELMSSQMQSLLEREDGKAMKTQKVTDFDYIEKKEQEALDKLKDAGVAGVDADGDGVQEGSENSVPQIVVIPAGEIEYAQMITEANSDVPGPVLAQIASGPLVGSRMIGSFEVKNDLLTITFERVVIDEVAYSIDAIALDPATTLPALATEVDHRYFQRVVLPAAAAFVEGFAEAVAETGRTDVTIQGEAVAEETEEADSGERVATGVQEAGTEISEMLEEMNEEIETLVIVASGTPMGILFLEPVTRPATEEEISAGLN